MARKPLKFGHLSENIGYRMRRVQIAVFADFIESCAGTGLRPAQYSALLLIKLNPGRKQTEIAEALGIQRPNFVAMMDEFDRIGITRREPSATDKRSYALFLTPKGEKTVAEAEAAVAQHEARINDALGAEGKTEFLRLLGVLERVLAVKA